MHRNAVLSRVDTALHNIRTALDKVENFASEFVFDAALHAITVPAAPPTNEGSSQLNPHFRSTKPAVRTKPSLKLSLVLEEWEPMWLDKFFHDPSREEPPLPLSVVRRLEHDLGRFGRSSNQLELNVKRG